MGLPTKKQLTEHKRGTRKALDTLEALENLGEENNVQPEKTSAKAKKSESKKVKAKKKTNTLTKDKPASKKTKSPSGEKKEPEGETKKASAIELNEDQSPKSDAANIIEKSVQPEEESKEMERKKADDSVDQQPTGIEKKPDPKTELPSFEPKPVNQDDSPKEEKSESNIVSDAEIETEIDEDTQKDKFLTFRIGTENYGLEIKYVTEIIVMQKITSVPDTKEHIRGVINLRGKVIPVMDVRRRFNLETREYDDRTCIIVVDANDIAVGLIVDTVNEVVDIPEANIDPPPASHSGIKTTYIKGMGKVNKQVKILLDVEKVLDIGNHALVSQ